MAQELLGSGAAKKVWLEGALAHGFAHATSDVDLRGIVPGSRPPAWESRIVDGIRVDLHTSSPEEIAELRALLDTFEVRRDDLTVFRRVRSAMADLRNLRTALSYDSGVWQPLLTPAEREGYRRWAVADQTEVAASLAEDLIGLLIDRLELPVEVTARKLELCLLALDGAAAGHPVLGDKWLPLLGPTSATERALGTLAPSTHGWLWFRPVQRRVTQALLSCWPVHERPGTAPAIGDPAAGWLPQRYADGWFLRRGDQKIPVTAQSLIAWYSALGPVGA
ncbi:hypothetical protein [Streptomyces sp. CBMA152]|uniref:hypothetical protein n=1 Tax=Streptomyces sp. CBMA152 TaxID=1896312 RepID=UPI00166130B3|nr:hypothetical protein [Streptomyces sp. CBMA152]